MVPNDFTTSNVGYVGVNSATSGIVHGRFQLPIDFPFIDKDIHLISNYPFTIFIEDGTLRCVDNSLNLYITARTLEEFLVRLNRKVISLWCVYVLDDDDEYPLSIEAEKLRQSLKAYIRQE